jgi:rhodanese-related sulfurtransferase
MTKLIECHSNCDLLAGLVKQLCMELRGTAEMSASVELISPAALAELAKERPVRLIDVRTPAEFEQIHASGAVNIPLEGFDPATVLDGRDEAIYFICRGGSRGQQACEKLLASSPGTRVVNVEGGTLAWEAARLPVVGGRRPISIERQIRIVAGSLVVLSILLSIFVHRGLLGIAGLVGAGLVFAGMSDICGMGALLGRMPWNRRNPAAIGVPPDACQSREPSAPE